MRGKKLIFLFVLISISSFSQTNKREEGIKIGIKGGLNLSTFYGDNTEDLTFRSSVNLGFFAEIIVSDKFSFQPELVYSGQGSFFEGIEGVSSSKIKYDYINLPLMAKFYLVENFALELGPQVGFLVNKKSKDGSGQKPLNNIAPIDFSLGVGLNYELSSGMFFQGRYNFGITNTNTADNNQRLSNAVIQLSVGYQF